VAWTQRASTDEELRVAVYPGAHERATYILASSVSKPARGAGMRLDDRFPEVGDDI
jgi:hypothetical protein